MSDFAEVGTVEIDETIRAARPFVEDRGGKRLAEGPGRIAWEAAVDVFAVHRAGQDVPCSPRGAIEDGHERHATLQVNLLESRLELPDCGDARDLVDMHTRHHRQARPIVLADDVDHPDGEAVEDW